MKKEAYYFSLDSNARDDPKILQLRMEMGWEGYGLFWAIIETEEAYSPLRRIHDVGMDFTNAPRMTQQEFANEVNINQIIARAERTKQTIIGDQSGMVYGDFTKVTDYQSALGLIQEANNQFQLLNAETRNRFQNNPANLLAFIQNDQNHEEAISLGLLSKEAVEASKAAKAEALKAAGTSSPT